MGGRKAIGPAVKVLAVLLVLGLLCHVLRRIGFGNILDAMRRVSWKPIGAAALLQFGVLLLWSFRWQQLMKREDRKSLCMLFPIYMAGVFGNVVTPGARVGGEPIRAHYMSRAFGGEKSAYLGTMLADKLGNGLVFMGFLVASVAFVAAMVPLGLAPKLVLAGAVALVLAAVFGGLMLRRHVGAKSSLLRRLLPSVYSSAAMKLVRSSFPTYRSFEEYVIHKLDNVLTPIARAAGSPKSVAKILALSAAAWMLFCLAQYVLFQALGAEINFVRVLIIVTISSFFGDISVSPGGAGFMEAAMIALCAAFGVAPDGAAAVTLIGRGVFYVFALGLGGLCLATLAAVYGRREQRQVS
ncbi:MAG: lysylphosphatidylglycerol synthase transmembrane domain-containing protein [Planctomycetota bacterium]|jgi:uncharacterized protein (TIRG00374 family)